MKTVVGLFNTTAAAQQVKQALINDGFEAKHINVVANEGEGSSNSESDSTYAQDSGYARDSSSEGTSIGQKISNFFSSLTGGDEDAHHHYASGVNEGGALLTVTAEDEEAAEIAAVLKQHGARDIEEGTRQGASAVSPLHSSTDTSVQQDGQTAIPVVEEQLVVGKREVDRGGVRIYSHIVERPVSEDVTLREERVNVQRRPANRAATSADFQTGSDSFELRSTGEEAIVEKTSRVVEEVVVGKQASERTEAIHDTVRKTEVEVEEIPTESTKSTTQNRY